MHIWFLSGKFVSFTILLRKSKEYFETPKTAMRNGTKNDREGFFFFSDAQLHKTNFPLMRLLEQWDVTHASCSLEDTPFTSHSQFAVLHCFIIHK